MAIDALQGLTVIECGTRLGAGMCGKLLSDLGAQVIKVEPTGGDPARRAGPFPGDAPDQELSGLYVYLNRGKRSITLDLETHAGRDVLRQLASRSSVLIAGGTYAELERWGALYEHLAELNPALVCTAISPFGLTGPYREYADSEIVVTALSGVGYYVPGPAPDPEVDSPVIPGTHLTDFCAGTQGATATMVAVLGRRASERGQQVDVAEQQTFLDSLRMYLSTWIYEGVVQPRAVHDQTMGARAQSWPCADGWVSGVPGAASTDQNWLALAEMMGNPEWTTAVEMFDVDYRRAHADEISDRIEAWTRTMPKAEVARMLQGYHIPCMPVNGVDDLLTDQQLVFREYFAPLEHPGLEQALAPSSAIRFDGAPIAGVGSGRAPFLGEHTREVLTEAGYTAEEIVWLTRSGVVQA